MPNRKPMNIRIKAETKQRLDEAKRPGQTLDGAIQELLTAQGK